MNKTVVAFGCWLLAQPALAGLLGPSGSNDDCAQSRSRAYCIMDLADLPDGPPDSTADRIFVPSGSTTENTVDTAMRGVGVGVALGQLGGAIAGTPGFGGGVSGILTLLSATSGSRNLPRLRFIAAMSQSEVKNSDPGRTLHEAMASAVVDLLRETDGVTGARLETVEEKRTFATPLRHYYRLDGGNCEKAKCELTAQFFEYNNVKVGKEMTLPLWLSDQKEVGFVWGEHPKQVHPKLKFDGKPVPLSDALLRQLSAKMPKWFYIYLPPNEQRQLALVLNEGKPLWFFKPGTEPAWLPKELSSVPPGNPETKATPTPQNAPLRATTQDGPTKGVERSDEVIKSE